MWMYSLCAKIVRAAAWRPAIAGDHGRPVPLRIDGAAGIRTIMHRNSSGAGWMPHPAHRRVRLDAKVAAATHEAPGLRRWKRGNRARPSALQVSATVMPIRPGTPSIRSGWQARSSSGRDWSSPPGVDDVAQCLRDRPCAACAPRVRRRSAGELPLATGEPIRPLAGHNKNQVGSNVRSILCVRSGGPAVRAIAGTARLPR